MFSAFTFSRSKSRDQACPRTGGGMPIYGGEAALRQMWAPRRGGDGARGLWKMLRRGRVYLERGLIFPKLGVENNPNCPLPVGSLAAWAAALASESPKPVGSKG